MTVPKALINGQWTPMGALVGAVGPWINMSLNTGWVGRGDDFPQYRLVGDEVQARGQIAWAIPSYGGNPMATFPVGYRPGRAEVNFTAMFMNTSGNPTDIAGLWGPRLYVQSNGNVSVNGMNQTIGGYFDPQLDPLHHAPLTPITHKK